MSNLDNFQDSVNNGIRTNKNDPITVSMGNKSFHSIKRARQYRGRQFGSSKLYTDIILDTNSRSIRIALKEDVIKETNIDKKVIDLIIPGIADRFIRAIGNKVKHMKLKEDELLPSVVYAKIPSFYSNKLIEGIQSVGGPIDYVYEGPTKAKYDKDTNMVVFEGIVSEINEYSKRKVLYLMIKLKDSATKYTEDMKITDIERMYDINNLQVTESYDSGFLVELV